MALYYSRIFAGGLAVVLLAACASETPQADLGALPLTPDFVSFDAPATALPRFSGGDLSVAASGVAPLSEAQVSYVGADSSDGPYSGFTPFPGKP